MRRAGESLQLQLHLPVSAPDGTTKTLRVLVDTGAQINLVRDGLFSMKDVRKRLQFASADGSAMRGGDKVQTLSLDLHPPNVQEELSPNDRTNSFMLKDRFWNADIRADIILSYCDDQVDSGVIATALQAR